MTLTRIIGDIHGAMNDYKVFSIDDFTGPTVQLGDFGIGFAGDYWHENVNDFHASGQHRFIRGNHDDPDKCRQEMVGYIPDGTVEDDVMFVGGAWSIDYQWRTEGVDWWRNEELSYDELSDMIELYNRVKPRVMITHDCPTSVSYELFIKKGLAFSGEQQFKTRTAEAFEQMFAAHRPEHWFFGHWHHTVNQNIFGTEFQCIGICDYVDIEL